MPTPTVYVLDKDTQTVGGKSVPPDVLASIANLPPPTVQHCKGAEDVPFDVQQTVRIVKGHGQPGAGEEVTPEGIVLIPPPVGTRIAEGKVMSEQKRAEVVHDQQLAADHPIPRVGASRVTHAREGPSVGASRVTHAREGSPEPETPVQAAVPAETGQAQAGDETNIKMPVQLSATSNKTLLDTVSSMNLDSVKSLLLAYADELRRTGVPEDTIRETLVHEVPVLEPQFEVSFKSELGTMMAYYHDVVEVASNLPLLIMKFDTRCRTSIFIPNPSTRDTISLSVRHGDNEKDYNVLYFGMTFIEASIHTRYVVFLIKKEGVK